MQWHYAKKGEQFGPVDEVELFRLAQQGEISPDDFVWNPTLGDSWVSASSIQNLFSTPPPLTASSDRAGEQLVVMTGGDGQTHNRDLMRMARESLHGHWGLGVGVAALYFSISAGSSNIPLVGPIVSLLIDGAMITGMALVFLAMARKSHADVNLFFQGFHRFGTALGAYILSIIFTLLWCLLLIIPGIIAMCAYAMTFYIIADDPSVGPLDAITRSKEMMRGNKWKFFCLSWRFVGWAIVCVFTFGIGFLWLGPYMQTAGAHFYDDIRPKREA